MKFEIHPKCNSLKLMQKRQDDFSQPVMQVHFDNYQTHAAQIRHVLAGQENQHVESRFFIRLFAIPASELLIQ